MGGKVGGGDRTAQGRCRAGACAGAGQGLGTTRQGLTEAGRREKRMVQDNMGSATQRTARASVCACKSARLTEFAKLVCFEFASVAGSAALPSSSFGVLLFRSFLLGGCFSPPSFRWWCFPLKMNYIKLKSSKVVVVLTPVWCYRLLTLSFLVGGAAFPSSSFGVVLFPLLALVVRCCFPPFAFWLALLLPFLLGVAFLFLLLLGAGAAQEPRRLKYRFVSFVFQCYCHACGLFVSSFF